MRITPPPTKVGEKLVFDMMKATLDSAKSVATVRQVLASVVNEFGGGEKFGVEIYNLYMQEGTTAGTKARLLETILRLMEKFESESDDFSEKDEADIEAELRERMNARTDGYGGEPQPPQQAAPECGTDSAAADSPAT